MRKQAQITAISAWKVETCDVDCEKVSIDKFNNKYNIKDVLITEDQSDSFKRQNRLKQIVMS